MPSKPILAYWNIRGLAMPIRTLLAHAGVDFVDYLYDDNDAGAKSWDADKSAMTASKEYDFPNLPYYTDGAVHLTQVRKRSAHRSVPLLHNR